MGRVARHPDERVVIVGGGTAGAATALALARASVPALIVEQPARAGWRVGEGLPPAANPYLRRLDVWDRFLADGHAPSYGNASAWGSPEVVDYSFIFDPYGNGWHLDRPRFDAMLLQAAQERGTEVVVGTATVEDRSAASGRLLLRVAPADGDVYVLEPPFVVDASGRTATVARLDSRREHHDRLVAAVGVFATRDPDGDPDSRTIVEAVEDGWWYSASIPGGRLVVAFLTDGDVAARLGAHRLDGWLHLLGNAFYTGTRVVTHAERLLARPRTVLANSSRQPRVVGSAWLAVGDAAIAHDPLSSQGLTSALLLGLSAAEAISNYLRGRPDAFNQYSDLVQRLWDGYTRQLAYYYQQEIRWPEAPFWARRHASGHTSEAAVGRGTATR